MGHPYRSQARAAETERPPVDVEEVVVHLGLVFVGLVGAGIGVIYARPIELVVGAAALLLGLGFFFGALRRRRSA